MTIRKVDILNAFNEIYEPKRLALLETDRKIHITYETLEGLLRLDYKEIDIKVRRKIVVHRSSGSWDESKVKQKLIELTG